MLQESNCSRNSSYLVPCVFKAIHMIEALRETGAGLRVEDLRRMTGYSRTTIYRILRTLAACRYIIRNSGGVYRLNYSVVTAAGSRSADVEQGDKLGVRGTPDHSRVAEFERWGIRFRGNGARMGTHSERKPLSYKAESLVKALPARPGMSGITQLMVKF
jgi:hypothetical protein